MQNFAKTVGLSCWVIYPNREFCWYQHCEGSREWVGVCRDNGGAGYRVIRNHRKTQNYVQTWLFRLTLTWPLPTHCPARHQHNHAAALLSSCLQNISSSPNINITNSGAAILEPLYSNVGVVDDILSCANWCHTIASHHIFSLSRRCSSAIFVCLDCIYNTSNKPLHSALPRHCLDFGGANYWIFLLCPASQHADKWGVKF